MCTFAYHEVKVEVKPTHLHPFYGSTNTQQTVLHLYSSVNCDKLSPTAYTVGSAGPWQHKWYSNIAAISGLWLCLC